jgi:Zn-dependent protease with chaperone function
VKEKGLDDIGWNFRENRLILGEDLLRKLTPSQLLAVVVHEFTHGRKRYRLYNWHYTRLFFTSILAILVVAVIIPRPPSNFVVGGGIISAFLLVFVTVSHWNEYEADSVASGKTSKRVYIAALKKVEPDNNRRNIEKLMHPSMNQRITKLDKVKG